MIHTRSNQAGRAAKQHHEGHHSETEHQQIEHDTSLMFDLPAG